MKLRIFVSYRRREDQWAVNHVRERLCAEFGSSNVFFDVESIDSGDDWKERLAREVAAASVVVMVYGRAWEGPQPDGPRRIDNPNDIVRFELLEAQRGNKHIIPVVIDEQPPPGTARGLFRSPAHPGCPPRRA